jgi:chromosome segregation ATPase
MSEIPECPHYIAHPQSVWFNEHWRPIIAKLESELAEAKAENNQLVYELDKSRSDHMKAYDDLDDVNIKLNELIEKLHAENNQLKSLMSVQLDMLEQNKKLKTDKETQTHNLNVLNKEIIKLTNDNAELKKEIDEIVTALKTIAGPDEDAAPIKNYDPISQAFISFARDVLAKHKLKDKNEPT